MSTMNCNPFNSLYCNLKVKLTGSLSENDLNGLYGCTLCNECHTASFNLTAREIAVSKSLIAPHVSVIGRNIRDTGNPYGIVGAPESDGQGPCETILFRGCTPSYKTPEILASVENLLKRKGIEYGFLADESCCGGILFNLGDNASGTEAVKENIKKFKTAGLKRIITICPGCYEAFNKHYKGQDGFDAKIILAVDLLEGTTIPGEGFAVQDACHAREKGAVVRRMLPGATKTSPGTCCGAGSGLMTHDRLLSGAKARKIIESSPTKIVTYCPFCYMSLSAMKPDSASDIYTLLDAHGC